MTFKIKDRVKLIKQLTTLPIGSKGTIIKKRGKTGFEIVFDEFVGQSIPLIALLYPKFIMNFDATIYTKYFYLWIVLSFFLFRFFDIIKPFPINLVDEKMKNALGVMLDDIIAGIYTTIVIYIIYALWF